MPELIEAFAVGGGHTSDKCPFCPLEKKDQQYYKTYGGAQNDGTKLGNLINEPTKFGTSTEADARPKDGKEGKDGRQNQGFSNTSNETYSDIKGDDTEWKFQAHHAISGKQCLNGHLVEKFIIASDKIKFDTGYSVNNPQNGIWMPSYPETQTWPKDPAGKFALAKIAMEKFKRQFHLGHHNITVDPIVAVDSDKIDVDVDQVYVAYVKKELDNLKLVVDSWVDPCKKKDGDKHLGNARIHNNLDHISELIISKLKYPPKGWRFFVSRHARDLAIKTRDPNAKLDFEK
jgi:hypothetical protein